MIQSYLVCVLLIKWLFHLVKNRSITEREVISSIVVTLTENSSIVTNDTQ